LHAGEAFGFDELKIGIGILAEYPKFGLPVGYTGPLGTDSGGRG